METLVTVDKELSFNVSSDFSHNWVLKQQCRFLSQVLSEWKLELKLKIFIDNVAQKAYVLPDTKKTPQRRTDIIDNYKIASDPSRDIYSEENKEVDYSWVEIMHQLKAFLENQWYEYDILYAWAT